jgi:drug/metabolite transporter (DMT)-like permease
MSSDATTATATARQQGEGIAALVVATFGWSWAAIIIKLVPLSAGAVAAWRLLLGAAFLAVVAVVIRAPWPEKRRGMVEAGVAFGVHQLLFIAAVQETSIAVVTLLLATQPLVVSMLSQRVLGERVPAAQRACALLAAIGVGIVVHAGSSDGSSSLWGNLLAALNMISVVVYLFVAKRARLAGAPALTFTAGSMAAALVVVAPSLALAPRWAPDSVGSMLLLALLALGPGNGHLLLNWALPRLSATLTSVVISSIPVWAAVWAHWLLGEPLGWQHVAGIALVIFATELGRRIERTIRSPGDQSARQPAAVDR